ncbi:unnamed protein product [Phytophthora lilii]|uniref:acetyl-CoA C-acetyltransferase n=1 Tax=Phytophthora lilii TaxID=2077276 RepID=A0A9W6UDF5_9STRA|nr:unnamed protein product [Phytophthora lilii]
MSAAPPAKKPRVGGGPGRGVCIVGVARTPCGSLQGKLSGLKASELAGLAIKGEASRQNTAYILGAKSEDGLFDAFENVPMGDIAEECARKSDVSREDQDAYAAESYRRALEATKTGKFKREVIEVQVPPVKRGAAPQTVTEDEEVVAREVNVASLSKLRPCFKPSEDFGPTVTAGNASPISDGAAALVLMSREKVEALGLSSNVQAIVRSFADAEQEPRLFTTSPSLAIPKALVNAGIRQDAVDFFEINEAFSVVACANMKLLALDAAKVNVYGGTFVAVQAKCL